MKLCWSARSLDDLVDIGLYIADDNPVAARAWVDRLRAKARAASKRPMAGRVVPEVGNPDVREVMLRGYRIVYRVMGRQLHVLTVFEGHRRFPADALGGDG